MIALALSIFIYIKPISPSQIVRKNHLAENKFIGIKS